MMNIMKCSYVMILVSPLSVFAQDHVVLKKVDPVHIAEPVAQIVENIVVLAQNSDNKDAQSKKEVAIQATVGVLANAIKIVLAATHRSINPEATQEEIAAAVASLSEEQLQEISDAIVKRSCRRGRCGNK